ncbi:hypothetical protein BN1263250007 [Stenotrophomonas thermophila]|nr:hypothetical protein BN1263250007 [Stenotrophomonas maltophilia]
MVGRARRIHQLGPGGGSRRGRCKYVHVSSVAASMRLTPLRNPPGHGHIAAASYHGINRRKQKQKQTRVAALGGSTPCVDGGDHGSAGRWPAPP